MEVKGYVDSSPKLVYTSPGGDETVYIPVKVDRGVSWEQSQVCYVSYSTRAAELALMHHVMQEMLSERRKQYEEYFQELQSSRNPAGMPSKKSKKSSAHVPIFSYYLTRNAFQGHYFVVLLMEKLPNSYVSAKIFFPSFH